MNTDNERSPFHRGEQAIQRRLGVGEKLARMGQRLIRDHMLNQHRSFFERLPFVFYGAVDEHGQPWAAMLNGAAGFIATPDDRTLSIAAQPLAGDPVFSALRTGSDVGLLGLEFDTRRRNRANGRVIETGEQGFMLAVRQSFGNCPKYIQSRSFSILNSSSESVTASSDRLSADQQRLVEKADTFFITTQFADSGEQASDGVDVSHRGGKLGFVKVENATTLTWPDFVGNSFFNTLGNLTLNPRSGLLFLDFERGDLLHLTGTAEIIWDGAAISNFEGAQRLVRFQAASVIHAVNASPLTWSFNDLSPFLEPTGCWTQ